MAMALLLTKPQALSLFVPYAGSTKPRPTSEFFRRPLWHK